MNRPRPRRCGWSWRTSPIRETSGRRGAKEADLGSVMADDAWLAAGSTLRIPRSELSFRATRAGGPGGQHVNTSSTRIELWWNLSESAALTEAQRELLRERLAHGLDSEG